MADILISVAAKVAEYTVAPIVRQVGYLFLYNKNIKDLEEQLQNLVNTRNRVQQMVDEAKSNAYKIHDDVSNWLNQVDEITKQPITSQLLDESGSNKKASDPSCFNLVQRHKLSRKAKKTAKVIFDIIEKRKMFDNVGYPVPLPGIEMSTIPGYQILESRTVMAKQLKDALGDPNVNKVGVYGMGGVGKTMLLNEVEKLVMKDKLFDQVIEVTVGQTLDVEGIQAQIGDKLRLELNKNVESEKGRAALLRNKLETENNILIMLDDLWKELDLVKVGIPCRSKLSKKGCKILITSRYRDVLINDMGIEKSFQVNSLSEEESWKFFMAIIGEFDSTSIEHRAMDVAKKCGGLPIALATVAKALKGAIEPIWKDALIQLENPIAVNIKGVSDVVYASLKLSYDYIKGEEGRLLFLLCSVFPDDYEIFVEDLQMYAMGMRLLNEVSTWDEARNRVIKLVDDLKSSSLLLESNSRDNYVKMHDVVRDVAIYIASKEANMSTLNYGYKLSEWREKDRCGSYKAIFGDCYNFYNLPQNLQFRNLELLILRGHWEQEKLQISDTFFEGMEKLKVLDLSSMYFQQLRISLTRSLVENLRMFRMLECEVNDIDIISQLKQLEILRIKKCPITYLPTAMSELTELKILEVSQCNLEVIPQNVFSSMTKLEELDLSFSFNRWGEEVLYKNKSIKNVTLLELGYLPHLISLKLDILDDSMLQDLLFLEKLELEKFCIIVGALNVVPGQSMEYARTLMVEIISQNHLIDRVLEILLQRCESLLIKASEDITNLRFKSNENGHQGSSQENSKNVIPFFDDEVAFPEVKDLTITGGNDLKMLWQNNGLIANPFSKLQTIRIYSCNSLRCIFPSNVVATLVFLNKLIIEGCKLLETIFDMEKPIFKQKDDLKVVPLVKLRLTDLRNLKCVWNKDPSEFLTFPNLQSVIVSNCHQLQSVFPASFINHVRQLENLSIESYTGVFSEGRTSKLVSPEIVCPSLRSLTIGCTLAAIKSLWYRSDSFPRLESLVLFGSDSDDMIVFPREMNQTLYNIEKLHVSSAAQLVQIFPNEDNNHNQRCANLKELRLRYLPELTHVWKNDNTQMTLMFDNLEYFKVHGCDKLKCLVPQSITFLRLRDLSVFYCHELMNLLSSLVAKSLVNLKRMKIYNCQGMTSILTEAEGEAEGEENEEVVFNKLFELKILELPRLARFHSGKCMFGFPSLESLFINKCPEMEMFSDGIISTPKLQSVEINHCIVELSPICGINAIIRNQHIKDQVCMCY